MSSWTPTNGAATRLRSPSAGVGPPRLETLRARLRSLLRGVAGRLLFSAVAIASLGAAAIGCGLGTATNVQQEATSLTGFVDSTGGVRLSYRLDFPARRGKVPAVVIGHGSGEQTKASCRFLSTQFLARGYATFCYDKRGVGESTGEYSMIGPRNSVRMFGDLAEDMAAGVRFLRSQEAVDGQRVGLAGNSQAGWIIPVAATLVQPAFMIILVGPTVSVGEEIFYSNIVEKTDAPLDLAYKQLPSFTGERGFDPRPVLESLNVPGLWLLGRRRPEHPDARDRGDPRRARGARQTVCARRHPRRRPQSRGRAIVGRD